MGREPDGSGRIEVSGLAKRFGTVEAVRGLSFTVGPGAVTGFLGPNGSGKTTTLRAILGLVAPTAGSALVEGAPYAELTGPGRVVGALLEAHGAHPARTARRHLQSGASAIGAPEQRVDEVLGLVGLTDAADRPAGGYSLGMAQRLALATALLGDPRILVLDEPGNGLDPQGIAWLREFLRGFARSGRSVLVSSHQLAEIAQTADRLVVISAGTCVYQGPADGLHGRPAVRVRCSDPVRLAEALAARGVLEIDHVADGGLAVAADAVLVGDTALAAGVALYGLVEERADLEAMFLRLTGGGVA
ncbi:ATP-binding cassette domain-containing protein [Pseudonocardia kujensis]|uniref:ATP-binding cassette domain-containing protein n=1 Tax=Pseudonocardia kujensis TaxID=1128675 RepID=UPI001E29432C|nr:ATP-binding cassette domain-containing protein [Pseudonocardia kujensis]MCE0765229.1 ATP-binding cassette domain-containing protein [Pseudonocardia kujensis]